MVDLALRENGWRTDSLGVGIPAAEVAAAVRTVRPRLVWLSASSAPDRGELAAGIETVREAASQVGAALAVGGRALTAEIRVDLRYSVFCDTVGHLVEFARAIEPELR